MNSHPYSDLQGRVVLVTGSSKAVGAETARRFAAVGTKVVVNGRDEAAVERNAASIRAQAGKCVGITADVTSSHELSAMQGTIRDYFGEVDVLAAYAGGFGNPIPGLGLSEEQWGRTIDADLTSKFLTIRTFARSMQERRSGNIILMSSAAGRYVSQASAAYELRKRER